MPRTKLKTNTQTFLCVNRGVVVGHSDLAFFQYPHFSATQFRQFVDAFKAYWTNFSAAPMWDSVEFVWRVVGNPSDAVWDDFCSQVSVNWHSVSNVVSNDWSAWKKLKQAQQQRGYYTSFSQPDGFWVGEYAIWSLSQNPTSSKAWHTNPGRFSQPPPKTNQTKTSSRNTTSGYSYHKSSAHSHTGPTNTPGSGSFKGREQSSAKPPEKPVDKGDGLLYSLLHLTPEAPDKLIVAAYKNLATIHHPDKGGDETKMQEINRAYDAIKKKRGI